MGATERVIQFIDYKGVTKYKFCKNLGFSNKFLDNSSNMGTDKACKILHYYPEINPEWLLTGKGSMLKSEDKSGINQNIVGNGVTMVGGSVSGGSVQSGNTNADKKKTQLFENQIKELKKEIKEKDQEITRLKKQVDKLFKLIP